MKDRTPVVIVALLFVVSGLMLTVIQAPTDWSFLAWAAYVPFALACSPRMRVRTLALPALAVGGIYWLGNLYWIFPITAIGWLGLGLYLALLWLLPAVAVRFSRAKGIPLFIALPILTAGAERLQGFPGGGFFWRFLGHSQYENLAVIQVADILGAAGVSFVVAMVNGLLADLILHLVGRRMEESVGQGPLYEFHSPRRSSDKTVAVGIVATIAVVAGTLLYGQWRLRQTPEYATDGPLVGSLQSNVPQSVKRSYSKSREIFDELMAYSKTAAAAGAELIVWPETMVQGILEPALWPRLVGDRDGAFDEDKAFHQELRRHAEGTAWLLVGAHGAEVRLDDSGDPYLATYNSAYFYRPDGNRDPGRYDKIHLVLFGEYIPFKRWFPGLFEHFMPEGYRPSLTLEKGQNYTIFEMNPPAGERKTEDGGQVRSVPVRAYEETPYGVTTNGLDAATRTDPQSPKPPRRFAVIICYEDTIPYVARNFTLDEQGRKQIDWLVNISNDGWFVRFLDDPPKVMASTELPQHAAICVFRAVENRLAVVRSVNTGISCLIDSTGRIRDGYLAASEDFPTQAMNRTALAGWFLDRLPIDTRVTFYSRHGEWFANGCALALVAAVAWPAGVGLIHHRRARKHKVTV